VKSLLSLHSSDITLIVTHIIGNTVDWNAFADFVIKKFNRHLLKTAMNNDDVTYAVLFGYITRYKSANDVTPALININYNI